jgi:uncharacterized protein YqjF (DUF2071 family)
MIRWLPGAILPAPAEGDLTHFLVERYVLYTRSRRGLLRGRISHAPYVVREAAAQVEAAPLFLACGFPAPVGPPDHVVCCDGTAVKVLGLEPVGPDAA